MTYNSLIKRKPIVVVELRTYMLLAYAKAMSTDMTPQQKMQVAKLTTILKIQHSIKED